MLARTVASEPWVWLQAANALLGLGQPRYDGRDPQDAEGESLRGSIPQATPTSGHAGMRHAIEAGWLLAAALIPVAITHQDFMLGFIQMPKVLVLRTTALYLVVMITFEWALSSPRTTKEGGALPGRLWGALLQHPARLVYFGAGAVLVANLVSVAFAPVKSIAIWGIDPGWDTYGLFNLASYLVVFAVVATHLRTGAQLRRLVWVLTGTSMVISLYAFGQHFGFDPLKNDPAPVLRAGSTFGNPIFVSSYLLMTLPLTVALFMSYRDRMSALTHIWIGAALITLQATAIAFSLARGPWLGVGVAEIAFVILFVWGRWTAPCGASPCHRRRGWGHSRRHDHPAGGGQR